MENKNLSPLENYIYALFPWKKNNTFVEYISHLSKIISGMVDNENLARIPGDYGRKIYPQLVNKYSNLPTKPLNSLSILEKMVLDLFIGVPRWRSPYLQYNVGAAVNIAASTLYALAMEENVYNINEGLAGNVLVAEQAVTNILSSLANIRTVPYGIFTFGGTATNLYAIKIGTRKAEPNSWKEGVSKNLKILVTEDAHFSHMTSADWLGIGINNAIKIDSLPDRSSNLQDAEHKMRDVFNSGEKIATIIINGGTTYGHVVDDIKAFVNIRNNLVSEFSLNYKPHIHVDSVIGWAWLMFDDYDFEKNPLSIEKEPLNNIKVQYKRIKEVNLADSWGIDFHKGVGSCPVSCSMYFVNNYRDITLLSKKVDERMEIHQLAEEFSNFNPVDYTLETSRPGGAALAALGSLHTLGKEGYQSILANLVHITILMRRIFKQFNDIRVCNEDTLGYVTMLRFYPPIFYHDSRIDKEETHNEKEIGNFIEEVNLYMRSFFTWDLETRMKKGEGIEYSFSSGFMTSPSGVKLSGIKLYPVSPHININHIHEAVDIIRKQKQIFDETLLNEL